MGLFEFISDYLSYFEKINIFFNIIAKKDRHPSSGMILIQLGSNDLGSTKGFELVHDIECDLLRLSVLFSDVKIVWCELSVIDHQIIRYTFVLMDLS